MEAVATEWDEVTGRYTLQLDAQKAPVVLSYRNVRTLHSSDAPLGAAGTNGARAPSGGPKEREAPAAQEAPAGNLLAAAEAEMGLDHRKDGLSAAGELASYDERGRDERGRVIWQQAPLWLAELGGPMMRSSWLATGGAPAASQASQQPAEGPEGLVDGVGADAEVLTEKGDDDDDGVGQGQGQSGFASDWAETSVGSVNVID